jgi:hypothetical protein
MTADDFRRVVLSMPEAVEGSHMQHPDFRVRGKIFATLSPGEVSGMVKLAPEQQQAFVKANPRMFVPCNGAWGRNGCTSVRLEAADEATLRRAVALAWGEIAAATTRSVKRSSVRRASPGAPGSSKQRVPSAPRPRRRS